MPPAHMQESPQSRSSLRRSVGLFNLDAAKENNKETPMVSLKRPRPFGVRPDDLRHGSAAWDASLDTSESWSYGAHNSTAATTLEFSPGTSLSSVSSSSSGNLRAKQHLGSLDALDAPSQLSQHSHPLPPTGNFGPSSSQQGANPLLPLHGQVLAENMEMQPQLPPPPSLSPRASSSSAGLIFPRSLSSDAATAAPRRSLHNSGNSCGHLPGTSSVGSLGSYRAAKPLQTAFRSAGLQSKRNRMLQDPVEELGRQPPETPCKRPPTFQTHKALGEGTSWDNLFDTHSVQTGRRALGNDDLLFNGPSHTDKSLKLAEGVIKRISLSRDEAPVAAAPAASSSSVSFDPVSSDTETTPVISRIGVKTNGYESGSSGAGGYARPFKAVFTSTPARVQRNHSDASTVTPRFGLRQPQFPSPSPCANLNLEASANPHLTVNSGSSPQISSNSLVTLPGRLRKSHLAMESAFMEEPSVATRRESVMSIDTGSSTPQTPECSSEPSRSSSRSLRQLRLDTETGHTEPDTEVPCTPVGVHGPHNNSMRLSADFVNQRTGSTLFTLGNSSESLIRGPTGSLRSSKSLLFDAHLAARFERVEVLGEGEFSNVYTVIAAGGHKCAVKRTKKPLNGHKARQRGLEEVGVLKHLSEASRMMHKPGGSESADDEGSDFVLEYRDAWEDSGYLYIMSEFCENGNLDRFLSELGNTSRLDEWRVWKILGEIACGLRFLHAQGVLHLDLKPANIFITFEGSLKIGDFGMAAFYPIPEGTEREGDREYIAPEVLSRQLYTPPADIFSFGIMMLEIAANIVLPDNGENWQKLRSGDLSEAGRLSSGDLSRVASRQTKHENNGIPSWAPSFMTDASGALDNLVSLMLSPDPQKRPSAVDILGTPEMELVDERRQAGAIVFEGEFGPPCESVGPSWQA